MMATKQTSARKTMLWLGGIVLLSLLSVARLQAQEACLPTDKAEIERIDRYIQELQTDSAKLTAFLDKVLQHPQYAVIIEPIIATAAQRLETLDDADKEASLLLTEPDWARIKEIVCMLLRSPGTTTVQTPTPPKQPETPAAPPAPAVKIWLSQNNKEYAHGEVIEVPYHSSKYYLAFALKNYPTTTKAFQWTFLENNEDITSGVRTNEPTLDNFGANIGGRQGKVFLKAKYDDKEVVVEIKIKKDNFTAEAFAAPAKKLARVAKGGQTLYIVNGDHVPFASTSREKQEILYWAKLSPDLNEDKYASSEVIWRYNDQTENRYEQLALQKSFTRFVEKENTPIVTSLTAGYPTPRTKDITIKWVDGTVLSFVFVPPAVSATLTKVFEQTEKGLKVLDKVLMTIGGSEEKKGVEIKVEPIKMTGKVFNQEDTKSRLYREVKNGSLSAGIKAKVYEKKFTHPALKAMEKFKVAAVYFYVTGEVGVTVAGGVDLQKYVESAKETGKQPYIEVGVKGCIEVGGECKLLVAKDLVDFEVKVYGQACLAGSWKWSFGQNGDSKGKISIPPIVVGAKVKIKTKDPLDFELVDYNGSISLIDEIILYP